MIESLLILLIGVVLGFVSVLVVIGSVVIFVLSVIRLVIIISFNIINCGHDSDDNIDC